jgi:fatty-acyl-CoA synthase
MKEYLFDPEATRAALTEDGYVRMGDLARLTEDGGFLFETRMGDVLRLGGFLVAPAEIEDRLQQHPAVAGAQVVAAGAKAVAFVMLRGTADEATLQAHCAAGLAGFKVPARIVALDAFPTTPSANGVKVQKAKLRQMAKELF